MLKVFSLNRISERNNLFDDNRFVFVVIALLNFLVAYLGDVVVFTDSFYFNIFTKAHYSIPYIEEIRDYNQQIGWLFYLTAPLLLAIKFLGISSCVFAAAYLKEWKADFRSIFKVVMVAEIALIMESVVRIVWLGFQKQDLNVAYYVTYSPLAAVNLVDHEVLALKPWLIPMLKNLSLFQLAYFVLLTLGFRSVFQVSILRAMGIVLSSYVLLFLLYVGTTTFFALMT